MAIKVNLKKYLKLGGRWQFVPVYKKNGIPKPAYVVINKEVIKDAGGEFYVEWRSDVNATRFPADPAHKQRWIPGKHRAES